MAMPTHTLRLKDVDAITQGHWGLDKYEIFDEAYREKLNSRIKREFWLNEIAHETIDIFIWRLELRMDLIMPRYNRMYLAELQNTDPLDGGAGSSRTRQWGDSSNDGTNTNASNGTGSGTSKGRTVASDTPQTRLAGNGDYASSLSDATTENSNKSTSTSSGSTNSRSRYDNNQSSESSQRGSKAQMIAQYRQTLINVDNFVIEELRDLFLGVWDLDHPLTYSNIYGGYYG
jgi:hypothetical protein